MSAVIYKTKKPNVLVVDPKVIVTPSESTYEQNYCVVSFVSPEDRIKQRFFFEANKFLCYDVNKQLLDCCTQITRDTNTAFTNKLEERIERYKSSDEEQYKVAAEILDGIKNELLQDETERSRMALRQYKLDNVELIDRFETYKLVNDKNLAGEFNRDFGNETSVRGLKFRGAYTTEKEARDRAEYCRNNVEKGVHSSVMPIGYWCPWDPNPDGIKEQEHMVDELNTLMHKYNDNAELRKEVFEKRNNELMSADSTKKHDDLKKKLQERRHQKQQERKKGTDN